MGNTGEGTDLFKESILHPFVALSFPNISKDSPPQTVLHGMMTVLMPNAASTESSDGDLVGRFRAGDLEVCWASIAATADRSTSTPAPSAATPLAPKTWSRKRLPASFPAAAITSRKAFGPFSTRSSGTWPGTPLGGPPSNTTKRPRWPFGRSGRTRRTPNA